MRAVGIDPSSTRVGAAITEDGEIKHMSGWPVRPKKGWDDDFAMARGISQFCDSLTEFLNWSEASICAIEKVSVQMNLDTVRKIAYFESAVMVACSRAFIPCHLVQATKARKAVLGSGKLKKEEAREMIMKRFELYEEISGDESDAIVMALWAEQEGVRQESDSPNVISWVKP